jgi:hypothetical protein
MSGDTWNYIIRMAKDAAMEMEMGIWKGIENVLLPLGKNVAKRCCISTQILRLSSMEHVSQLVGSLFVVGLRKRRPRLTDGVRPLVAGDKVHFISEVRLEFSDNLDLRIKIHYQPWLVHFDFAEEPPLQVRNLITGFRANNNNGTDVLSCEVGDEFEYDGRVFNVVRIEVLFVVANSGAGGEERNFELEEVLPRIAQRLM